MGQGLETAHLRRGELRQPQERLQREHAKQHHPNPDFAFLHITIALVNVSYNLRMIRNWHERTGLGDPNHPLLAADEGPGAWEYITPEHADTDAA